jgi:predicted DNA-binding WGR domain protein
MANENDPAIGIETKTLDAFFAAKNHASYPADDVVHMLLPLMRAVAMLHEEGRVAALGLNDIVEAADGSFRLKDPAGLAPKNNVRAVQSAQPHASSALKIVGEYRVTVDDTKGTQVKDLQATGDDDVIEVKPSYLTGLRAWEMELGHHDEMADIFRLGLLMAALACGLNPSDSEDVERFSMNRSNLFAINSKLHPVIGSLIVEAAALNRHERATDLASLAKRLETYRDQPVDLDLERALVGTKGAPSRRNAVLALLRDRLFDLSRRNRLIYFRPTMASVNLTEASVPIVLRLEAVRADQLCIWDRKFATDVLAGKPIALNRWLRFEDQKHLPSSFDRLIQDARRDKAEYGFSNLRLVVAFLRWHNLKENPQERIVSPLLWLPVEVSKVKGVRDQYQMRCPENVAEFNPALRHHLRQLYNIQLPETVDLSETSLADVHANLLQQIQKTEPGVRLELQQRPAIRLIFQKAVQRANQYARRHGSKTVTSSAISFSYDREDFRPLGLALFEKFVKPSPLPQRLAAGGHLEARPDYMAAQSEGLGIQTAVDEGHKYAWEVDLTQVTLANFNYKKMSLVRDFSELLEKSSDLPAFDQVFSVEPRDFDQHTSPAIDTANKWNVVAADATQDAAVAMARTGRSFIIQGPPGTGKSQTITNLIADYAARGKRVLFVCEKRAALDVVYHRLAQAGLEGLSCIIHDSQEDKKGFIQDLKSRYELWGENQDEHELSKDERQRVLTAFDQNFANIASFEAAIRKLASTQGQGLRHMVRQAAALPTPEIELSNAERERLPDYSAWDAARPILDRSAQAFKTVTGMSVVADHPFARLNAAAVTDERPIERLSNMLAKGEHGLDQIEPWLNEQAGFADGATELGALKQATDIAKSLLDTGLAKTLSLLDPASSDSLALVGDLQKLKAARETMDIALRHIANWRDVLSAEDTFNALAQARRYEGSFFNFLSGTWRKLKSTVATRYDFSKHPIKPTITNVLERLHAAHEATAAHGQLKARLAETLKTPDLDLFLALRDHLGGNEVNQAVIQKLLQELCAAADPVTAAAQTACLSSTITSLCEVIDANIDGWQTLSVDRVAEVLRDMRENLDDLPDVLPALSELHRADKDVSYAARSISIPLSEIEALIIDESKARIERRNPELQGMDINRLLTATRRSGQALKMLRTENAKAINSSLHNMFRDHVKKSTLSVTQLDAKGREFKQQYANGRRELEHEFGKSMRYRSIRDLAGGDTGNVVRDLKPIWLMSPLSVSDTLPLRGDIFDVVIFDEASQIPTEEAVPALCRSSQVIIVGDEMQLPPTRFFSATPGDNEMEVLAEEDGEQIAILMDADSLLNQAARNLPATLLAWHYRSRSESLISFSNAAFYEGQLVTIPDQSILRGQGESISAQSDNKKAWATGSSQLLAAPITFHKITDGVYDQRGNAPEAAYVAGLVHALLTKKSGLSIGIVAFSEAQQSEIETALDQLAAKDDVFAAALEAEYEREDDGQFNGLFVKNLENVQGDERDIILMSVCYAPDRKGRMIMNFGPINQRGGEKRLNVIFSRARKHMAIVTTISPEAITNVHNDGARALRSFLSFAEARSRGSNDHAQAVLSSLNASAAKTFGNKLPLDPVRSAIADELRSRGHTVHEHVGGASFRCDLAVVNGTNDGYKLGILLDRESDGSVTVEERFLFRPEILRSFGWRVIDVPVTSWLRDREDVIDRIEQELEHDSWQATDSDPFSGIISAKTLSAPKTQKVKAEPKVAASSTTGMTEYRFEEGTSKKFWRIGVDGNDLIVEYGRIGSKGQRVVKTYSSPAQAKREETKLVLEKTRKGYAEQ